MTILHYCPCAPTFGEHTLRGGPGEERTKLSASSMFVVGSPRFVYAGVYNPRCSRRDSAFSRPILAESRDPTWSPSSAALHE
jgi:hypothetical protein